MAEKIEILVTADDRASGTLTTVGDKVANVVLAAASIALMSGAAAVTSFGVQSVKSAMEAEEAMAQLEAVIASTGGVAGVTADEAAGIASSLQNVTRFSDETILSAENLLLTFTNIGSDIFPDVTEMALNMSQALGQDAKSSAIQLGKALQDPILGATALRRVGVNLNDAQMDLIKGFMEQGDLASAQGVIMKELAIEFGGAAKAAGETFGGQLDIVRNRLDEVKERVGEALIPILSTLVSDILVPMLPTIEKLAEEFGQWIEELTKSEDFKRFIEVAAEALSFLLPLLGRLILAFLELSMTVMTIGGKLVGFVAGIVETIVKIPQSIIATVLGLASDFVEVGSQLMGGLVEGIRNAAGNVLEAVLDAVGQAFAAAKDFLGIHSPSDAFASIGANIMAGMAEGISGGISMPVTAIGQTVPMLTGAAGGGGGAGGRGGGGGGSFTFVYSPMFSAGDRVELENKIAPAIRNVIRHMQVDGSI